MRGGRPDINEQRPAAELAREPIQGLWIGPRLSTLELLTIRSFVSHGHPFHLYVYDEVADVPEETVLLDAATVLPASAIFRYREEKSYAGFANRFRYQLLHDRGGWWVDLDTVCLRPFELPGAYVFSNEDHGEESIVTNGIMKTPSGAPVLAAACEIASAKDPKTLRWGETGPRLLASLVERFDLEHHVRPPRTFCPIPWYGWRRLIEPDPDPAALPADTYAIHMWNEMWRRAGEDKDASFPASSLYERLKERYL